MLDTTCSRSVLQKSLALFFGYYIYHPLYRYRCGNRNPFGCMVVEGWIAWWTIFVCVCVCVFPTTYRKWCIPAWSRILWYDIVARKYVYWTNKHVNSEPGWSDSRCRSHVWANAIFFRSNTDKYTKQASMPDQIRGGKLNQDNKLLAIFSLGWKNISFEIKKKNWMDQIKTEK